MQLCTVTLTGTKMSQIGKVDPTLLQPGKMLSIHRRPDNAYDPQAMSVHAGEGITAPQVGWIPAKEIEDKTRKEVLFNVAAFPQFEMRAIVEQYQPETKFLRVQVLCLYLGEEEQEAQHVDFGDEGADRPGVDD